VRGAGGHTKGRGAALPSEGGRFTVDAEAVVFGFPNTPVEMSVRQRPLSWRAGGAARTLAVFVVVAPLVAIVPPHAPWAIGASAAGAILARRRWSERFTLERVEGACPKCGAPLSVRAGRLKLPHPVACDACHHQTSLRFPEQVLRAVPMRATG
jgi:hypothetical protein